MDLLRLDSDTYRPVGNVIEDYSSLIWTERFRSPGEFELQTPRIREMQDLLPMMTFLSLRDTREVMFVERHEIVKDSNSEAPMLKIKGRTLDAFLEHRALEGPVSNKKYKMSRKFTPAEAAAVLIWNAIVNTSDRDVTRPELVDKTRNPLDAIPGTVVTDSTTTDPERKRRWLTGGSVYPQLEALLRQGRLGLRTVRPPTTESVTTIRFDNTVASGIDRSTGTDLGRLRFDLYNGKDRRIGTNVNTPIVFAVMQDHLEEDAYLRSIEALKTMILIVPGKLDARTYYRNRAADVDLSGWDRRIKWVDGGEPDLEEIPELQDNPTDEQRKEWQEKRDKIRAKNAETNAEFREDLRDRADLELEKSDRVKLMSGKVTDQAPYIYNRHYFLGDKVTFLGDYGYKENMQVIEYVRTYDGKTEEAYPGLAVVD